MQPHAIFYRQRRPKKPSAALIALFDRSTRTAIQRGVAVVVYCPTFAEAQKRWAATPKENPFAKLKRAIAKA